MTDSEIYTGAALMGAVAGMRSMSAPALVSRLAHSGKLAVGHAEIGFLEHASTAKMALIFAAAEGIADKLPFMPRRTKVPSLVARALSGGFAGAAVCSAKKKPVWIGAVLGAATAVGAAFGAYKLRRNLGKALHLPDPLLALAEDAVVVSVGYAITSRLRSQVPA